MRVFVFSWNTASIPLSKSLDAYHGICPDFFLPIMREIQREDVDVVVFGFQEDRYPGSYFHTHLLRNEMVKYGYTYANSSTLMGVGVTTYKNLFHLDLMVRGLATSVYVKKKYYVTSTIHSYCTSSTRGKGGLGIYLTIGQYKIGLVNVHLPFSAPSLIQAKIKKDPMLRQNEVNQTNIYFNDIIRNLMDDGPSIFFGDFNYRNGDPRSATAVVKEIVRGEMNLEYDELRRQMQTENIYTFREGVDNVGPSFPPTCKLVKKRGVEITENKISIPDIPDDPIIRSNRGDSYYNVGKYNQRIPSHTDRILYTQNIECLRYGSFDVGEAVKLSDHAPIFGLYEINLSL